LLARQKAPWFEESSLLNTYFLSSFYKYKYETSIYNINNIIVSIILRFLHCIIYYTFADLKRRYFNSLNIKIKNKKKKNIAKGEVAKQ
jgi:hypothetical protein